MGGVSIGVDAIRPVIVTDLFQRFVELMLAFPLNVCPSPLISKIEIGYWICDHGMCVLDQWNSAAADDRNDHDYAECNKPESSRYCLHSDRCFESARGNYQA